MLLQEGGEVIVIKDYESMNKKEMCTDRSFKINTAISHKNKNTQFWFYCDVKLDVRK